MGDVVEREQANVHLRVLGEDRRVSFEVRLGPSPLDELIPMVRVVNAEAHAVAVEKVESEGRRVSCSKGCAACCRQPIPISPIEAKRLSDVVAAMPEEERKAVEARFADARARKAAAGVADDALTSEKATWRHASRRYFEAQIPCPFLVDEVCSIYPERPIVCASYAVTSPAELCSTWDADLESVPDALGGSGVLERAVNALAETRFGPVALVDALAWAEAHGADLDGEHDGESMFWTLCEQVETAQADRRRKS